MVMFIFFQFIYNVAQQAWFLSLTKATKINIINLI